MTERSAKDEALDRLDQARDSLDAARAERDAAIIHAASVGVFQTEIGERIGLTRDWVRRIIREANDRLAHGDGDTERDEHAPA